LKIAADNRDHPFVIMRDFNTDPSDSRAKCGDQLSKLVDEGWQHAVPKSGASYWAIKNGSERRLDHAFTSRHFDVLDAKYIIESGSYVFAGKKSEAM
jgi:endonuclease/exonuclease/phosphatase family metal-dependent hydrolase